MKNEKSPTPLVVEEKCSDAIGAHEHVHAANCGHASFVHAGHVCYLHEGHYHYMHNGHAHECPGPKAQPAIDRSRTHVQVHSKPASVHKLPVGKSKGKK